MDDIRICPETGKELKRGISKMTLKYKGLSETFDMPGWYSPDTKESIHSREDLKFSDEALEKLKTRSLKNVVN